MFCVCICVYYIYIYIYIYIHISFFAFNKLCDQNSQVDFLDASFKTGFNFVGAMGKGGSFLPTKIQFKLKIRKSICNIMNV